jgi:hypothetical protein
MRVAELRRTVTKIDKAVENPRKFFDMSTWVEPVYSDDEDSSEPCGTACCFAGWAVTEKERKEYSLGDLSIRQAAAAKFELGYYSSQRLFLTACWPEQFKEAYYRASKAARTFTPSTARRIKAEKRKVRVLRERVEHFIKTEGD